MGVKEIPDSDQAAFMVAYVPPFVKLRLRVELVKNAENNNKAYRDESDNNEQDYENAEKKV